MQLTHRPAPNYMASVQRTVTSEMRAVLVDWLVEVAEEYKLVTETLYLTVAYLDRFLSARRIDPPQLQLLGVTSMCIAAKFEEIFPPPVEKFSEITDNGCTVQDIVDAEIQMLGVLDFHLAMPTAKVCLLLNANDLESAASITCAVR
jgi:cyclin-A